MNPRAVALGVVALLLLAAACAAVTVATVARGLDRTAVAQLSEAPDVVAVYLAKSPTREAAIPEIYRHLQRDGLVVRIFDEQTGRTYGRNGFGRRPFFGGGGPRPPGVGRFGAGPGGPRGNFLANGVAFAVADAAGARQHHVTTRGFGVDIAPDIAPIMRVLREVALGFVALFLTAGAGLWWYVRRVKREALRPLIETTVSLRRLAQRDFTPRTIVTGDRSVYGELARAYNEAVEAVAAAFAERQAAEREMQRFIADAGHELRTPLTIVTGYVDVLDAGGVADRGVAERIFAGMRIEARRMRRLIDKLIVLARMETPGEGTRPADVDVVALVQRIAETLEPLGGGAVTVEGARHAFAHADEDELDEALSNVIENALKYAPGSPVAVRIARDDQVLRIEIADRGPGMTVEEQRNAFERFYRGDRRGEVPGSGLGLAIAKRAVERNGGRLEMRSSPGEGTTFTVIVPAAVLRPASDVVARLS